MPTVREDIVVNAPLDRVYQEWTQYERFPMFMENVKEVRRTGPDMTHWVVEAAGQRLEWDAKTVTEERRRVAWTAQGEAGQSGEVRFEQLDPQRTKIDVRIDYSLPSTVKETIASALGIDDRAVHQDLENFKELIEAER